MRKRNPSDPNRISLSLTPEDALYLQAALRYYVDTITSDDDDDEMAFEYITPIRHNEHLLARLARLLHDRGYGYIDPT